MKYHAHTPFAEHYRVVRGGSVAKENRWKSNRFAASEALFECNSARNNLTPLKVSLVAASRTFRTFVAISLKKELSCYTREMHRFQRHLQRQSQRQLNF